MQACNAPKSDVDTAATQKTLLDSLTAEYHEDYLRMFPIEATLSGDKRYNDTLPNDISAAYLDQLRSFYEKYDQRLDAIDKSVLDEEDQLSHGILKFTCGNGLTRLQLIE